MGDQARRNQRGKQNRNLCSAAALKPENFIRQQEKVAWSIVCQCKLQLLVLLFPKKVTYFRQLTLGQKTSKVSSPTSILHFSEL